MSWPNPDEELAVRTVILSDDTAARREAAVMLTVPSVRDHCGQERTAKSASVPGHDGDVAVF